MAYTISTKGRPRKQVDFFTILVTKGRLKESGLDKQLNPYRIYEYEGQDFKLKMKRN